VLSPDVARVPEPETASEPGADGKVVTVGGTKFAVSAAGQPEFEQVAHRITDIQDMVPV
jgi:CO dehydrogenase/acetyl-CoA synthase delta subunit